MTPDHKAPWYRGHVMARHIVGRVNVWVQEFKGRKYLQLQWHDPHTGTRRTRSTLTADPGEAEKERADLEYELNHGMYGVESNLSWAKFRGIFEAEYVAGKRTNTRHNFAATLDVFEKVCRPGRLRGVNERTVSAFAAGLRKLPGRRRGSEGMAISTIKVNRATMRCRRTNRARRVRSCGASLTAGCCHACARGSRASWSRAWPAPGRSAAACRAA